MLHIAIFLLSLLLPLHSAWAAPDKIHVGVILDQSGPGTGFTVPALLGIRLAYSELSPAIKERLVLHFEDDGLQATRAISAFEKLRTTASLDVVINGSSPTGNAIAPLAERYKLPFIAIATDPRIETGKQYVVNYWPSPIDEGALACKEAKARGYKSVAIISTTHSAMAAFKAGLLSCLEHQPVFDQEVDSETKDFKSVVSQIKRSKPDAIFLNLFFGQVGIFARQYRELGGKGAFFSIEVVEDSEEYKNSNAALEGTWFVQSGSGNSEFNNRFLKSHPDSPTFAAAHGYDTLKLIAHYLESGQSLSLNEYLHRVSDFSGALGKVSIGADNRFRIPVLLKEIKGAKFLGCDSCLSAH